MSARNPNPTSEESRADKIPDMMDGNPRPQSGVIASQKSLVADWMSASDESRGSKEGTSTPCPSGVPQGSGCGSSPVYMVLLLS